MIKYLVVALIAALLYTHIPKDKNPFNDVLSFVLFAVLLTYFFDNSCIKDKFYERFDSMANPAGIASSTRQVEIAALESQLASLKQTMLQEFKAQTDPSVSASKNLQIQLLEKEREQLVNQYGNVSKQELVSEETKQALMKQNMDDITKLEIQIANLKQPQIETKTNTDSCGCEQKIQKVLDDYIAQGKIHNKPMKDENDMAYNQLTPEQMKPLGSYDNTFTNKWDHGFTYLDTSRWAPPTRLPPVCKTEQKCPVCPMTTSGFPIGLMEFDSSRQVMPPDNINVQYIKERLNKSV